MLHPDLGHSETKIEPKNGLEKDLYEGESGTERRRVAYVSKMFAVRTVELPENQRRQLTAADMRERARLAKLERDRKAQAIAEGRDPEEGSAAEGGAKVEVVEETEEELEAKKYHETLLGFARLYSGTLKPGQSLFALLPKYNASLPPTHPRNIKYIVEVKINQLYTMMGRELVLATEVGAGELFAIAGLEGKVGRNGTLCGMPIDHRAGEADCWVNLAGVTQTVSLLEQLA